MTLLTDKTMPIVVAALAGSLLGVLLGYGSARRASSTRWSSSSPAPISRRNAAKSSTARSRASSRKAHRLRPQNSAFHIGLRALTAAAKVPSSR